MKRSLMMFLTLWSISMSAFGIEEPAYEVIQTYPQFEVRQYHAYLVAEVLVPGPADQAGNLGFNYLAGYIFGKNKGSRKIAMTAPVAQTPTPAPAPIKIEMTAPVSQVPSAGGYLIQFTMPREFTLDTLPEPIDPKVQLREIPAQRYAVLRYSGGWSQSLYEEKLALLKKSVEEAQIATTGEPIFSRYNAPFSLPIFRRNEIWLALAN